MDLSVSLLLSRFQNPQDNPYHRILRAAHVIKGAAANLMCGQLRQASFALEQAATRAHEAALTGAPVPPDCRQAVQQCYQDMQWAGQNYVAYLQSIGV
jgi:HPt (histidine-containing phosphotransfer) domain-containing protein